MLTNLTSGKIISGLVGDRDELRFLCNLRDNSNMTDFFFDRKVLPAYIRYRFPVKFYSLLSIKILQQYVPWNYDNHKWITI